ncbi:MAG TPA: DUF6056 family protein, partial [Anaerolineaceae bacterium]|nr:DUF6056 family protein [Anaerolineaceae bacterium]
MTASLPSASPHRKSDAVYTALFRIVLGALLLSLVVLLAGSVYTRYHADDFCTAGMLRSSGWLGAQVYWYTQWSGRFAFYAVVSLAEAAGVWLAPVLPVLTGLIWLAGLAWMAAGLFTWLRVRAGRTLAWFMAAVVLFVTLFTLPNLFQSMFWQTGLITYVFPLVLLTYWAALFLHWQTRESAGSQAFRWLGLALLAFIAGGFSETSVAVQVVFFTLGLAATLAFVKGPRRASAFGYWGLALAASLAAMAAIFFAPGNQVRQALLPETPGLVRIVTFSIRNAAHIAGKYVIWSPLTALASVMLPGLTGLIYRPNEAAPRRRSWVLALVGIPLAGAGLVVAACAPTVYAMNAYPDDRVIVVPQFILACTAVAWGFSAGWALRERIAPGDPIHFSPSQHTGIVIVLLVLGLAAPVMLAIQSAQGLANH